MARRPRKGSNYRVFAADPGQRTGVCLAYVAAAFDPRKNATPETFNIADQDVWPVRQVGTFLASWIKSSDLVVYEGWRLYKTHALEMIGDDMQPSQVVGMIRYEAWQQKRPLLSRGARVKKGAVERMPDWLLAHMALSSEQHDQDAIMHAWYAAEHIYYGKDINEKP